MSDGFPWGPWRVALEHPTNACAAVKARPDGYDIEVAVLYGGPSLEEPLRTAQRDRLAHLVAAAPELASLLAESLREMEEVYNESEGDRLAHAVGSCPRCDGAVPADCILRCRIRAALAKAGVE